MTLSPNTVFKNTCLNAIREFGFFEHEPPIQLAWSLQEKSAPDSRHLGLFGLIVHQARELGLDNRWEHAMQALRQTYKPIPFPLLFILLPHT